MVKLHEDEAQMCHSALPDAAGNEARLKLRIEYIAWLTTAEAAHARTRNGVTVHSLPSLQLVSLVTIQDTHVSFPVSN